MGKIEEIREATEVAGLKMALKSVDMESNF